VETHPQRQGTPPKGRRPPAGASGLGSACGGSQNTYLRPFPFFVLSFTVVFGCRLTVDCLTNLPVVALRPRFPPDVDDPRLPAMFRSSYGCLCTQRPRSGNAISTLNLGLMSPRAPNSVTRRNARNAWSGPIFASCHFAF